MEENFEILSQCPLFSSIGREDLESMLQCLGARKVFYEKNQHVFLEGDPARWVGVVLSGGVQIIREDLDGNRSILASAGPGELFGEVFACAGLDQLPVTVTAIADSHILRLSCRRIIETCSQSCAFHSLLIQNLLRIVARKNLLFPSEAPAKNSWPISPPRRRLRTAIPFPSPTTARSWPIIWGWSEAPCLQSWEN